MPNKYTSAGECLGTVLILIALLTGCGESQERTEAEVKAAQFHLECIGLPQLGAPSEVTCI